jgi:parallel beta-helix repeat protein
VIDKSINLKGEDKNTTIIDSNYIWVIQIYKDSVNFSGFTIIDAGTGIRAGYYNLIISDNNFISCTVGIDISLSGEDESYIISNSFINNSVAILADDCYNYDKSITISKNTIISSTENAWPGYADIHCWDGKNFVITNNTLICNYPNVGREGIELDDVSDSIIERNEISGYDLDAIYLPEESCNNIITNNNISNNYNGIYIMGKSNSNKIINNNFINNENDAHIRYIFTKNNLLNGNYWDTWIGLKYKLPIFQRFPKIISGSFLSFGIDWHPASEPYDI